ncbi:hypothetical protein EVAR_21814_1 [Eumeta japonica]|uniref:Uncharacterized protein n=1 Tax=Eumeta variegata TaxID=151549 RepID=A0A4C1SCR0_EUMVA|nr:hypothetical protein EVAR_21814_1 [Eumeta japonica]
MIGSDLQNCYSYWQPEVNSYWTVTFFFLIIEDDREIKMNARPRRDTANAYASFAIVLCTDRDRRRFRPDRRAAARVSLAVPRDIHPVCVIVL